MVDEIVKGVVESYNKPEDRDTYFDDLFYYKD